MTVRAKFMCNSVEQSSDAPVVRKWYDTVGGKTVERTSTSWQRTYRFSPQYDASVPEDQRYAMATPLGELRLVVDNPAVSFMPGQQYYLDFTPIEVNVIEAPAPAAPSA